MGCFNDKGWEEAKAGAKAIKESGITTMDKLVTVIYEHSCKAMESLVLISCQRQNYWAANKL